MQAVLIVDDDRSMLRLVEEVLRRAGNYSLTLAETGLDGIRAIEEKQSSGGRYGAFVSDMRLPDIPGEELLRRAKSIDPSLPVIVITGYKTDDNVLRCLEYGACDYITKPLDVRDLIEAVERACARPREDESASAIRFEHRTADWVELTAPSDYEFVERFRRFTENLYGTGLTIEEKDDIRLAVDEIGQNAVEWGNREDRSKRIRLQYRMLPDRIVFRIEDEGAGFDVDALADPSKDPLAHIMERMSDGKRMGGYGIFMTRKVMDDVIFSERGNVVIMTKRLRKRKA